MSISLKETCVKIKIYKKRIIIGVIVFILLVTVGIILKTSGGDGGLNKDKGLIIEKYDECSQSSQTTQSKYNFDEFFSSNINKDNQEYKKKVVYSNNFEKYRKGNIDKDLIKFDPFISRKLDRSDFIIEKNEIENKITYILEDIDQHHTKISMAWDNKPYTYNMSNIFQKNDFILILDPNYHFLHLDLRGFRVSKSECEIIEGRFTLEKKLSSDGQTKYYLRSLSIDEFIFAIS